MLDRAFSEVYTKFKLEFYKKVFQKFHEREASLSVVETFSVEIIFALNRPTVKEFAEFTQISAPNAAYKVNSLIRKGYIRKVQSQEDKREYHLEVTDRFMEYYNLSNEYVKTVMERVKERIPEEDAQKFAEILETMSRELMPELELERN